MGSFMGSDGIAARRAATRGTLARGISAAAVAAAMMLATPAFAQADSSTLQGHIDGAAAGTQVTAVDRNTGQRIVAKTDAEGNYRILGVRPSTYTINVDGKPAQTTTVLVGQTTTVDFVEAPAETATTGPDIVVRGSRSIVNVRTQSVTTNITPQQIENLPQNKRNFLSFAELAPGVAVTRGGNAQVQAGATSSSNTNVLLDGLSFKNPINHGGVFGQNFGLGNPFPQNAIQEYKVDTQNFGAETGQVGSALITAVTKTGGNTFHGSAFIEWQPNSFIEQPYFDKKNNVPKPEYDRKQFGGELGGPIIPDVLSFYVAGEGTAQQLPGATAQITGNVPVPGSVASAVLVPRNTDFHQGLYFGKLTWFASNEDTLNLQAFIRRENNLTDIDANASLNHGRTILTHQDRYQLQWKHSSGDFLNFLNMAYDTATQSTPSVGSGPEYLLTSAADFNNTVAQLGANSFNQGDSAKSYTLKDDATLVRGDHTVKLGGQITYYDLSRTVNDHFNGSYYFVNPGATGSFDPTTAIPYGARINVQPTPTVGFTDTQFGFYVQDEWKPDDHWTVNAGIRWDLETNANNNKYVTPANIAAALRAYPGWKARGIDPEDYITDGTKRKPQYDTFQPRLGLSYDVNGDRDLVIFGGAGRYYDRSLFIEGVIETLTNSNNIVTTNFCGNGVTTGCTQFTPALRDPDTLRATLASTGASGSVFVLNNKTKLPYSDQFDLGVRKRLGPINAELTFSHIRSRNIFQFVRANFFENGWYTRYVTRTPIVTDAQGNYVSGGVVTGCSNGGDAWIQDNSPGGLTNADGSAVPTSICAAQNAQLPGFSGKLNRGASDGKADYNALYFKLEKPFTATSTWGITTALTVQLARTNDAQELNSDEFYNGTAQDVYGTHFVRGVEKYRLVSTFNYRAPYDFQLSGNLTLSSGPSFGHFVFAGAPEGATYGNLGGVYYPNPFIAYKRLDLRIAKTFKLPFIGADHEITADFQAFNVFNWLNRDYSSWGAGSGSPAPLIEQSQIGNDARSFQAGLKYAF